MYAVQGYQRYNPFYWLIGAILLLYLFPSNSLIWFSRALCCNYLIPIVLVLLWLILYSRLSSTSKSWNIITLSLIGFCTGFSHESFALSLSGAMFIYFLIHLKTFSLRKFIPVAFLWLGTLLVVISPGNFQRQGDMMSHIINFFHLLPSLRIIYILTAVSLFSIIIKRNCFYRSLSNNLVNVLALSFSILFGMIANSGLWSMTAIEFYSSILLISLLWNLTKGWSWGNWGWTTLYCLCIIIFGAHQLAIVRGQITQRKEEIQCIQSFIDSPNEFAFLNPPKHDDIIKSYIASISLTQWTCYGIALKYADLAKMPIFVGPDDISIIRREDRMSKLLIPGTARIYKGNYNLWSEGTSTKPIRITLHRLKRPLVDLFRPKDASQTFIWTTGDMATIQGIDSLHYIFPYSSHQIISADTIPNTME